MVGYFLMRKSGAGSPETCGSSIDVRASGYFLVILYSALLAPIPFSSLESSSRTRRKDTAAYQLSFYEVS